MPKETLSPVKCANCGYLAVRHRDTRELMDAEERLRTKGEIPSLNDNRGMIYDEWPICFVRKLDFREALFDNSGTPQRAKVINEERYCETGFTPWIQGFTPKEHLEMNLLELERERLDRKEEAERSARVQQAKDERDAREAQAAQERQWRTEDTRFRWLELSIMGGIVTVVTVAAQIVAAYISRP